MFNEKKTFSSPEKKIKPQKNRQNSSSLGRLVLSGLLIMSPGAAYSNNGFRQDEKKIEISATTEKSKISNPKPEDYDIEKMGTLDLKYINEKKACDNEAAIKIISTAILFDHSYNHGKIVACVAKLDEYVGGRPEFSDMSLEDMKLASPEFSDLYEEYQVEKEKLDDLYKTIMSASTREAKERLNTENVPESIKECVDNAHEILKLVESERANIIKSINSENYLKMLQIEFNCSLDEAKAHQKTRLKNVENVNYLFMSSKTLSDRHAASGLFYPNTNIIIIPYDIDFMDNDSDKISVAFFKEIVAHEFWHAATNATSGMSLSSKALLEITRDQLKTNDSSYNIEYYGDPTERYVRFKSLESELLEMKIWSKDKIFSRDCSDKMLEAYINKEFKHRDSYEFIEVIVLSKNNAGYYNQFDYEQLYLVFSQIFNSIASLETNKTYYPEQWWGSKEEKA